MSSSPEKKKTNKILIIEDEGDMCLLLNILLNGEDMELDHVQRLFAAEEYLQKKTPEIIIMDNKLPDGFGMDFIPFLKKDFPNTKIIMISGYDSAAKDAALACGADIYLEKPFTRDQLFGAVMEMLNAKTTTAAE